MVWRPTAERRLTQIWNNAIYRAAVTDATDLIEAMLRSVPRQVGEPFQKNDPAGKEDHTTFDDARRRIELVENYVNPPSSPGSGNGCD